MNHFNRGICMPCLEPDCLSCTEVIVTYHPGLLAKIKPSRAHVEGGMAALPENRNARNETFSSLEGFGSVTNRPPPTGPSSPQQGHEEEESSDDNDEPAERLTLDAASRAALMATVHETLKIRYEQYRQRAKHYVSKHFPNSRLGRVYTYKDILKYQHRNSVNHWDEFMRQRAQLQQQVAGFGQFVPGLGQQHFPGSGQFLQGPPQFPGSMRYVQGLRRQRIPSSGQFMQGYFPQRFPVSGQFIQGLGPQRFPGSEQFIPGFYPQRFPGSGQFIPGLCPQRFPGSGQFIPFGPERFPGSGQFIGLGPQGFPGSGQCVHGMQQMPLRTPTHSPRYIIEISVCPSFVSAPAILPIENDQFIFFMKNKMN